MRVKRGGIKIKSYNLQSQVLYGVIVSLVLITFYSLTKIDLGAAENNPLRDAHYFRFLQMAEGIMELDTDFLEFSGILLKSFFSTFGIAFLSTLTGLISGIILALLSAQNISNKRLSVFIRSLCASVRAVPTFLIVLLCISIYGMTGTSAVVGMVFHSTAFFVKVLGEAFEGVEEGAIEAIKSLGGSWFNLVHSVIIPGSITKLVAWSAFRLEINFGIAVIMGPIAAVPNSIGTELKQAVASYNFGEIFIIILVIFFTMFGLQHLSEKLKERARVN